MVHWNATLHVLKYLKGCPSLGVFYPTTQNFKLVAFSNADWGSCTDSRKSLTGYCIFLGSGLLSWKCKKQNIVSVSSAEVEYRAMATTTRELVWLSNLLKEFLSLYLYIFPSTVTIWLQSRLQRIRFSMREPSILTLTVML